jgi:hypothetical protein
MSPQNWGLGGGRRTLRLDLMTCVHTVAPREKGLGDEGKRVAEADRSQDVPQRLLFWVKFFKMVDMPLAWPIARHTPNGR